MSNTMYNNHTMASHGARVQTHAEWLEFIAGGRSKTERKANNNTYARIEGPNVAIKLHNTDIVTITPANVYTLNSGKWQTVTTKERLNKYTPGGISQRAGIWYMRDGSLFYDGVSVNAAGDVIKPQSTANTEAYERKLKAIKKQAKQYASDYVTALQNGLIDYPSGSDCWACLMKGPKGQEPFQGSGHIQQHIDEKYYVPSLLVNAGRAAGYRDEQIGLMGIGGHRVFIEPQTVIYKYIVKQLQAEL